MTKWDIGIPSFTPFISSTTIGCDCSGLDSESLLYPLECGGRKLACWIFYPSENIQRSFKESFSQLLTGFPFSVVYQIYNTMQDGQNEIYRQQEANQDYYNEFPETDNRTPTTTEIVIAPLQWAGHDTGAALLTNMTLKNGMGDYLYNLYYQWFKNILYIFTLIYLIRRLLKLRDGFDSRIDKRYVDESGNMKRRSRVKA